MSLHYQVETVEQDIVKIVLDGGITVESSEVLGEILKNVKCSKCIFNLKSINQIDSLGIRSWIQFMESFAPNREIEFEECCPSVVMQINMIPEFRMGAKVRSVYGEFTCPACEKEQWKRIHPLDDYEQAMKQLVEQNCEACGNQVELDVDEESFFCFLRNDHS